MHDDEYEMDITDLELRSKGPGSLMREELTAAIHRGMTTLISNPTQASRAGQP